MEWSRLSPPAFEDLVGDLLQAEWGGPRFERFGPGPDGGIDLRRMQCDGRREIVQCKHYRGSGWSGLRRELDRERDRLPTLHADRYVVATSVDLMPDRKGEILGLFSPWVLSTGDILGGRDVEALLRRHPQVERAHPILWMPSADVLERLLHAGIFRNTAWTVEEAEKDTRVFVRPRAYEDARQKLGDTGVCIVSGPPGIGKTTIAHMLLLEYVREGFSPVVLRASIDEGFDLYRDRERQFFLFDDFLGQTDVSEATLARNEDDRLLRFLSKVRTGPDKRLVMTTREYVLRDALRVFERLRRADAHRELERIVLDLQKYARVDKARILCNHAWTLGREGWDVLPHLAEGLAWKPIVDHRNFSPRLVRMSIEDAASRSVSPESVPDLLVRNLENPTALWEGAFGHLDDVERAIARVMVSEPGQVEEAQLFARAVARVDAELGMRLTRDRYLAALPVLEGTFLRYDRPEGSPLRVSLANPSVKDFLLADATADPHRLDAWLGGAILVRHLATLVLATVWGSPACRAISAAWMASNWRRVLGRLVQIVSSEERPRAEGATDCSGLARALDQVLLLGDWEPWKQQFVEEMGSSLAPLGCQADPAAIVDLVHAAQGTDDAMRPWIQLAVASTCEMEHVEALSKAYQRRPSLFGPEIGDAFLDDAQCRLDEEWRWVMRYADDEESALATLDQIDRIAGQLGVSTPVGQRDRDAVRDRFADRPTGNRYREAPQPGPSVDADDDRAIARLFSSSRDRG